MRTNRAGRECPSWCTEDHQAERSSPWCQSVNYGTTSAHATLEQPTYKSDPSIDAWVVGDISSNHTASSFTADSAFEAERIAKALEIVAGMRKPEIRDLAANVRRAAAEAWPEKEEA